MRRLIDKRPSAAMILSIIALFAALGGTSYAAATISGKQVKNGSLTGADVKNRTLSGSDVKSNSLGGGQVNESKLGQVPSSVKASQADNASKADSASKADNAIQAQNATTADSAKKADSATKADSADTVADNAITGSKVADRSLGAVDVAIANGSPTVDLPSIPAHDCAYALQGTGVNLNGATVMASASDAGDFSMGGLSIHVAKSNIQTSFRLVACNMTAAAIDPAPAAFDYVAIK